ncbi:MAG: 4'-phosphopantetheinyl transferase superfamily protein [Hyphomicrobiales bacterium]|nr:4'-phosphopantetheinyl transferase superfamily protein [Hyphomicrobiales bacterium]
MCLQRIVPPNTAVVAAAVADATADLYPQELRAIAKAVTKRRHEFATGRALARLALAQLGYGRMPIPVGPQRRPMWPAGTIGSLSHCRGLCAAVVARTPQTRALGLDLEWIRDVSEEIVFTITTATELARNRNEIPETELPGCLFSIREAVFKAYNPVTESFLDFKDVEVELDGRTNSFAARLANGQRPSFLGSRIIGGRFAVVRGFAVCLVAAPTG